ncbi:MAG: head GIN domain-containing protein [Erythrobacter sp.]|jgi:hypothetical protein|nr:head GIN domain-containing protein [Erythrobacter sp.]
MLAKSLHRPLRHIAATIMAFAGAALLSACAFVDFDAGGMTGGVPLAELDMSGSAPTSIALAGPDTVILTEGETLDITVEGDQAAIEKVRFKLEDDELKIGRENGKADSDAKATIRVTMPPPGEIAVAGSGSITAPAMARQAELDIAGSGSIEVASLDAERLEVNIGGSGTATAAGKASRLEVSVAGSGDVRLAGLSAERVEVSIAGSGDVELASDGTVEASIAGSGDVTVTGNAKCTLSSVGSGKLHCNPATAPSAPAMAEEE